MHYFFLFQSLFVFCRSSLFLGPLLKEILGRMQTFRNGQDTRRAYLYSAHDITLVNLLRTMGFTNEYLKPGYGAMLVFQLHYTSDLVEDAEVKVPFSFYFTLHIDFISFRFIPISFPSFFSSYCIETTRTRAHRIQWKYQTVPRLVCSET